MKLRTIVGLCLACLALPGPGGRATAAPAQFSFLRQQREYSPGDVMPGAETFVRKETYWEAYGPATEAGTEDSEPLGYVFLTDDIIQIPGYSGKSINTLLGIDREGTITGIKIVDHSEPIVLLGLGEGAIDDFAAQYVGKRITDRILISDAPRQGYTTVDAITGATVTSIAENAGVLEASRSVAIAAGILEEGAISSRRFRTDFRERSWADLREDGALGRLVVSPADIGGEGREPVVDLWFAVLNPPTIGRNLLGPQSIRMIEERVAAGDAALYIGSTGSISFKGSGFARGGIFDRFSLEQGGRIHICRDIDFVNFPTLEIEGAPRFNEGGIFFLGNPFDPTRPFTFHLTIPYRVEDRKTYATFSVDYTVPDDLVEEEVPFWAVRWRSGAGAILLFSVFILFVAALFVAIRRIAPHPGRVEALRLVTWTIAASFLGLYLKAQPSTTQVLTFFTSSVHLRFPSETYLSEPIIFLFWIVIFVSVPVWGRGFFCGWLCPYGALLELLRKPWNRLAPARLRRRLDRWEPPRALRLVKYALLGVILAVSLASIATAEILAEVEPFKTFILRLERPPLFVAYFVLITAASVVLYRLFCRFLCPLGAVLALFSRRPIRPLERYAHCGTCRICERDCMSHAIARTTGRIDHSECFQCWSCQSNMVDAECCPVVITGKDGAGDAAGRSRSGAAGRIVAGLLLLALPPAALLHARAFRVDAGGSGRPLARALGAAAAGDTVHAGPGVHAGPVTIAHRIVLEGEAGTIVDGGGTGHVVMIAAPGAALTGMTLRNSGDDIENADAGIWVAQEADGVRIEGNTITDCRFGIWVNGSPDIRIAGNRIQGRAEQDPNLRGDGIHFWSTKHAQVLDNVIVDARDGIYMELTTDSEIRGNTIHRSRYSVHTMWCDRNRYIGNRATGNLVGLALMFSKGLEARGNLLYDNATHGLLMIQVTRSTSEGNLIIGNTKGLFVYNSLYNTIRDNLIAGNTLGIHYWAGSEDNEITGNSLIRNKIQVKFIAARDQAWPGNYWSDYTAWDVNDDGRGDSPYRSHTLVDALLWNFPTARLMLASPSFQVLAVAERAFPVISVPKVVDEAPRMEPTVPDWQEILDRWPPRPGDYYGTITKLPHIPGGSE